MRIGIVSPSGPSTNNRRQRRQFKQGIAVLESFGFEVEMAPHARSFHLYYADTPEARVADLHAMYAREDIDLILAANGGWPASHLLRLLDYELIRQNPKPLLGFSDISILLNAIWAKTGVGSIHGPLLTWGVHEMCEETRLSLLRAFCHAPQSIPLKGRAHFLGEGSAEGTILGGNLSTLTTLLGTPYEPDWRGAILFWEEEEEKTWTIDRMLTHLQNAGVFEKLAGMVIGQVTGTDEVWHGTAAPLEEMLERRLGDAPFPVVRLDVFGHQGNPNVCLPIGGRGRIAPEALELDFVESAYAGRRKIPALSIFQGMEALEERVSS